MMKTKQQFEDFIVSDEYVQIRSGASNTDELAEGVYMHATTEANKRIAELESEVAELKAEKIRHDQLVDYLKAGIAEELEQRILDLQADNDRLREALEFECGGRCNAEYNPCYARIALSATPAQSLQAHDNEVKL